jgi:hypothetical protein
VPPILPTLDPTFRGFLLRDGRRAGFCWDERPRCVNVFGGRPHLLTKLPLISDSVMRCTHRPAPAHGECDAHLYVALLHFGGSAHVQGEGQRMWLVVETTNEHVHQLRTRPMILLEKLALLDCVLPGVTDDLIVRRGVT